MRNINFLLLMICPIFFVSCFGGGTSIHSSYDGSKLTIEIDCKVNRICHSGDIYSGNGIVEVYGLRIGFPEDVGSVSIIGEIIDGDGEVIVRFPYTVPVYLTIENGVAVDTKNLM